MLGRKELFASTLDFHTTKVKRLYNRYEMISGIKFESNAEELDLNMSIPVPNNDKDEWPQEWCEARTQKGLISTRYKKLYLCSKFEGVLVDA